MENEVQWHNFSIYCNLKNSSTLMSKAIKPFLDILFSQKIIEKYIISIGSYQGQHIKFMVETQMYEILRIEKYIQKHINGYLNTLQDSIVEEDDYHGDILFLPYPNNSVRYNTFRNPPLNKLPNETNTRYALSKALFHVITEEDVSQETLFSFKLYIQLIYLLRNSEIKYRQFFEFLYIKYVICLDKQTIEAIQNRLDGLMGGNEENFKDIFYEVSNLNSATGEKWMNIWQHDCRMCFDYDDTLENKFLYLLRVLNDHLDINNPKDLIMSIAIHHNLSQWIDAKTIAAH